MAKKKNHRTFSYCTDGLSIAGSHTHVSQHRGYVGILLDGGAGLQTDRTCPGWGISRICIARVVQYDALQPETGDGRVVSVLVISGTVEVVPVL